MLLLVIIFPNGAFHASGFDLSAIQPLQINATEFSIASSSASGNEGILAGHKRG
ncbi:MAG: hypothetical protein OXI63_08000 [Candidatus Poribacteria bacterium]|nr:hypothetical protein [Candidatus Poribacteria bacterium]